ncbi:tRNA lysidine(34) synthetase TilS [Candidatus Latescibacterota bacterium]
MKHNMFSGGTALVALSGGGDSIALLHILSKISGELGITVEAAHLNHSLRGKESERDESFCRGICDKLAINLIVERLEPGEILHSKSSIETAARDSRMAFLQRIAALRNAERIVTGHTSDDLAETLLQRILRGTGPAGLSGILPVRDGKWVRPLLSSSRDEIRDYLMDNGIKFCEDSSNNDTDFFRNRIRHELIPLLRERFSPNIRGVLGRLAEISRAQEDYLNKVTAESVNECIIHADDFKILLDKSKFMDYHISLKQRIIRHCLSLLEGEGRDADMGEIEHIIGLFDEVSAVADITSRIRFENIKQYASFSINAEPYKPQPVKIPGETLIPNGGGSIRVDETAHNTVYNGIMSVSAKREDVEKYGSLTVGTIMPGDLITPYADGSDDVNKKNGNSKERKIRDIFSSFSIPQTLRNYMPIVRSGAVPIWIPGILSSECLRYDTKKDSRKDLIYLTFSNGIQWH